MTRATVNNIFRTLHALVALIVVTIMCCMPQHVIWIVGNALGWFFCLFPSRAKRIATQNVDNCFSEMPQNDRRRLVRKHFRLFGVGMLSIGAAWMAPGWRIRRLVRTRDQQHYDRALADGRNIILLTPHLVALDVCGVRLALDRPMVTMYRRSKNAFLTGLSKRRARFGTVLVEREASLRPLVRLIREGRPFFYLPDQDLQGRGSVFAPFFGIPASTVTALSRLVKLTAAVVLPCIPSILPGGRGYEMRFLPPMENFPTDDIEEDARRMNLLVEEWIREIPEQYMWAIRRFKTRPPGEPAFYK